MLRFVIGSNRHTRLDPLILLSTTTTEFQSRHRDSISQERRRRCRSHAPSFYSCFSHLFCGALYY